MERNYEFAMLSQSSVKLTTRNIWQDIANSQCYHNTVLSLQKKYMTRHCEFAMLSQFSVSLQQELYGRTLRFRNVITIRCRAYSKKYMARHCEFAMLSQFSVKLTAINICRDTANSQCYHNPVSSLQQ